MFVTLKATFTVGNVTVTAQAAIELTKAEDPLLREPQQSEPTAFPVRQTSYDLRFFKATPTQSPELFSISNPTDATDCIAVE